MSKKRVKKTPDEPTEQGSLFKFGGADGCTKKGFSCHESHPVLSLGKGKILGASCTSPRKGFDVYVGLDWGMKQEHPLFPWNAAPAVTEVYFPITDGRVPKDVKEFAKMIDWLAAQLELGKAIHVGCIGGHGRTGLLLAALVRVVTGDKDAGAWVRKHHCSSAIETTEQIEFLTKHYEIAAIKPSKGAHQWAMSSSYPTYPSFKEDSKPTILRPVTGRSVWGSVITYSLTNDQQAL